MAGARKLDLARLWNELRRRHVVRVVLLYLVAAWVVAQVADILLEAFGMEHLLRFVIAALGAGLPVALVLSWFFDITPSGMERTPSLEDAVTAPAGSIAVLPFANLSEAPENEYFSDGLSEEIRNQLAKTPGLQVAARSSSFAFKGQHHDVREIGRRLGVAHVLEGGVRKHADAVRISLQLVNARNGYQVWSESFERRLDDIFALQSEIARSVISAVNPRIVAQQPSAPATSSFDAYNLYLLGRHHFHRRTEAELERAVECFKRAIEVDPRFARAHAGLADAYSLLSNGYYGNLPNEEAIARALPAALRALELAPELAEPHASLGLIRYRQDDFEAAEKALHDALARNPGYTLAHVWLGNVLLERGRYREALERNREALTLDPLSPIVNSNVGFDALRFGDEEGAEARFSASIEIDRDFPVAYSGMARLCARRGQLDRAYLWIERALERAPTRVYYLARKGMLLLRLGLLDRASPIIRDAYERSPCYPEIADAMLALGVASEDRDLLAAMARGDTPEKRDAVRAQAALAIGDIAGARTLYERAQSEVPDPAIARNRPPMRMPNSGRRLGELDSSAALAALVDDESAWRPPHRVNLYHLQLLQDVERGRASMRALLEEIDAIAALGIVNAESNYWAACAYALLGEPDQALKRLEDAIRHGWRNAWWARRDWNLAALVRDPRCHERLAQLERAIAKLAQQLI